MDKEAIIDYYRRFNEDERLKTAYGILEEAHTRKLILKNIAGPAASIFDIGGGTGPYSLWLGSLGYSVHYSDIVPGHVQQFRERLGTSKKNVSCSVQDARQLSYNDSCADLIILNGPLYHLHERTERLQVLQECKRILKPNGKLLAFTIGRLAGLLYALSSGKVFDEEYYEMTVREVTTGVRRNQSSSHLTFDIAYFHTQQEIEAEMLDAGFDAVSTAGVLGPAWNTPDLESVITDEKKRERLLDVAEMMEMYPLLGPKMMSTGVKSIYPVTENPA